MNHAERINLSVRHQVEVLKVTDMANAVGVYLSQGYLPDSLEDGDIFDDLSEADRRYHPSVQPMVDLLLEELEESDYEMVLEYLNQPEHAHLLGIYLQVATPRIKEDGRFSWGFCRLQWIFGNTYEEAFTAACEWAKEHGHDYD